MTAPLRIAFFVGSFPVTSETFIVRQITGLLDLGHDVRIFADGRGDDSVIHEAVRKYDLLGRTTFSAGPPESIVWEMPVRPVSGMTWPPGAETPLTNLSRLAAAFPVLAECAQSRPDVTRKLLAKSEYGYRALSLSSVYRFATLLKSFGGRSQPGCSSTPRGPFDILHAHFGPVANSFRFARELFHAPFVVSFHGYDFCTVPRQEGPTVYEKLWPSADVVLCNSRYTRACVTALGCPAKRIALLPVGLDLAEFSFHERRLMPGEPVRLLTVARLVAIKGHEHVIRAVAGLKSRGMDVTYDVVGDGPLRPELAGLIKSLGLSEVITLHGSRTEGDVRRHYAQSHLFILASASIQGDAEGQGLSLQEAQACGLPVIATSHGAFPEGVAPGSVLVPERDPNALAAAVESLVSRSHEWAAIGRAGRAFVEDRYDIKSLNRQLVSVYRTVLSGGMVKSGW